MSSSENMPISEGFLLSAGAMFFGMCAACLTCILKSRCKKISVCGVSCERDVIPASELDSVNVDLPKS